MSRAASRPRQYALEEGMWFMITLAVIVGLAFLAVFILLPH
jgi:hypothetical protein